MSNVYMKPKFSRGQVVEICKEGLYHPIGTRFRIADNGELMALFTMNKSVVWRWKYWSVNLDNSILERVVLFEDDVRRYVAVPAGWEPSENMS